MLTQKGELFFLRMKLIFLVKELKASKGTIWPNGPAPKYATDHTVHNCYGCTLASDLTLKQLTTFGLSNNVYLTIFYLPTMFAFMFLGPEI